MPSLIDLLAGNDELTINLTEKREDQVNQAIIDAANQLGTAGYKIMTVLTVPYGWSGEGNIKIRALKIKR